MSGIAAIISFDGLPVERALVESMTAAMAYRGPDGISQWTSGSVALGHCMLRTTAESLKETQPLANEDQSVVLVMDGWLDNWLELRGELLAKGRLLRGRSDAELVLRAYESWGQDCVHRLGGDFAFVVWDRLKHQVFCARDRLGNKSLHYHWNGRTLAVASDLHPLLALPWIFQKPNEGMIAEFLGAEWHSLDETLWEGIMRLPAGECMVVDESGPRLQPYWQPDPDASYPYRRDEEWVEHYREVFTDCVRRTSRSHLPVAYEVSGGLDSSAVFCVAESLRREGRLPAPSIDGYTLGITDISAANEIAYARAVAMHLHVPVHEVEPWVGPLEWYADQARQTRDFPGFPNAMMFQGIRSRSAARGSRVTLTGEGGDQWLQGSGTEYAEALAAKDWGTLSQCLGEDLSAFGRAATLRRFVRDGLLQMMPASWSEPLVQWSRRLRGIDRENLFWLSAEMQQRLGERRRSERSRPARRVRTHGQRDLLTTLYMPISSMVMALLERNAAQLGQELRYPMRSSRFVEFAFATPERMRRRGARLKFIHVQAMQGLLPKAVLQRMDKAEFSSMFLNYVDTIEERLFEEIPLRRTRWLSRSGMRRLCDQDSHDEALGLKLWALWGMYGLDVLLTDPSR